MIVSEERDDDDGMHGREHLNRRESAIYIGSRMISERGSRQERPWSNVERLRPPTVRPPMF